MRRGDYLNVLLLLSLSVSPRGQNPSVMGEVESRAVNYKIFSNSDSSILKGKCPYIYNLVFK